MNPRVFANEILHTVKTSMTCRGLFFSIGQKNFLRWQKFLCTKSASCVIIAENFL